MSVGDFPESLSQAILVRIMLVGRLGVLLMIVIMLLIVINIILILILTTTFVATAATDNLNYANDSNTYF